MNRPYWRGRVVVGGASAAGNRLNKISEADSASDLLEERPTNEPIDGLQLHDINNCKTEESELWR